MKNEELYQTRNILVDYANHKVNNIFSYAIFKNIELIDIILKSFDRLNEMPIEISKYEVERRDICEKHAKVDDKNDIMTKEGDKIFLWGCSYNGSEGPFDVIERPKNKRYFRCVSSHYEYVRIKYSQIDWIKTAESNNVALV